MEKTQNYNLNKPEVSDPMRLADFNENSDLIDAALTSLNTEVENVVYVGSYTGNGTSDRTIALPWKPKFVLLLGHYDSLHVVSLLVEGLTYFSMNNSSWGYTTTGADNILLSGCNLVLKSVSRNNINGKTVYYVMFR